MGEMQGSGYPKKFIEKAVRDQLKKALVPQQSSEDEETNKEEWQAARIPFIEGVSYEVRRIAQEALESDARSTNLRPSMACRM